MRIVALSLLSLITASAFAFACSSPPSNDESATPASSDIIGGVDAKSARLDAVGAILYRDQNGALQELCSATLIGKQQILTAKHCAVSFQQVAASDAGPAGLSETRYIDTLSLFFAIGWDARAAARTVPLDGVTLCNEYNGGWIGNGCDFSVYHLASPVTDIKPLRLASTTLDDASLNKRFIAIGFGAQNVAETAIGTRKAGSVTLRATHGAPLHTLFPLDAFTTAVEKDEGAALAINSADALKQIYDMELKAGYELFVGAAPGDVQVCHGDSGGPLLANVNGELVIQGVASAVGLSGARLPCNMGAIYAAPGPAAQQLVKDALTDPCEGIPAFGRCDGDVAVRCTNPDEGPRRVVKTDCAELLQHCAGGNDADGGDAGATVSCVD